MSSATPFSSVHFEIYRAPGVTIRALLRGGDWRWRFCNTQGKVIARGDGYRSREECMAVIDMLQRRAAIANVVDLSPAKSAAAALAG